MAGLTASGLSIKTIEDIIAEIEAEQLATIDSDLDTSSTSVIGQLNQIYAARELALWELLLAVYQAAYPNTATGVALSQIAALTGTIRRAATKATIYADLAGTTSTLIPAGSRISVQDDPNSVFETLADFTLTAAPTDAVLFRAVDAGSDTTAVVGEVAVIEDPVSGWTTATFAAPYTAGADEEDDTTLRLRRTQELTKPGTGTVEAIKADLLAYKEEILSVGVFENLTGITDANGLPPWSIEVLVEDDGTLTDQEILDQIWLSKPAGTQTYGNISGTVEDTAGNLHTLYYSNPDSVTVHIELDLEKDEDQYVGDDAVKTAIADWAQANLSIGDNVNAAAIVDVVMEQAGVKNVDLTSVKCENTDPPTTTNHVIAPREKAAISTTNIDITATEYVV